MYMLTHQKVIKGFQKYVAERLADKSHKLKTIT